MRHFNQYLTKTIYLAALSCVILCCSAAIFSSCSKETNDSQTALVNRIWEYSKNNPKGFTLDIQTFKPLTKGIAAAYQRTQDGLGKEGIRRAVCHASSHENIVGGWLNSQTGYYYFDSVKLFDDSDLDAALLFAKENKQTVVYDLTNQKEIAVSAAAYK